MVIQVRVFYLTPSRQLDVQDVEEIIDAGQRCLNLGNPKEALKYFEMAQKRSWLSPHRL